MASLKRVFTGGARSGAAGTGFRGKSNPPASSGSSTGGAGQGLVGDRAKTIVALEAKVNNGTATKAEIAELKKLETANEEATTRARVRASETRRDRKGVMPTKTEQPKDAVATYMKTGEKLEGFTPTPRQVEQRKRNVAARGATNKKAGGKIVYRPDGGRVRGRKSISKKSKKTRRAAPKSNPRRSFVDPETGATSGTGMPNFTSGKQKKMGGGKVMKYKKGGIIYKQGGGVIKANNGGQNIVDSGYTKV